MAKTHQNRLESLVKEQNDRVLKVEELTSQIDQCKAAIAQLKEEHDYTRGQITLLQDMMTEEEETTSKTSAPKEKK